EEHQMKMARDNWADDGGARRSEEIEDAEPSQFVEGERYPIFEHTFIGDWQHVAIPLGLTALAVTGAVAVAIS
ncbi:hypothetical protein ACPBYT_24495, partial [Escherichia coli]|uniref:hypothetical protein n=1 Tax=Escherichia coli TaxID=562 RepID=UPI003C2C3953